MLSAMSRSSARVLWTALRMRELSSASSKPPRRRKASAGSKAASVASDIVLDASIPPIRAPSTMEKPKVSASKITQKSAVIPKDPAKPISKPSHPEPVSKSTTTREHWALLSMTEAEPVSSHVALKLVDFSQPFNTADFSEVANSHRVLASFRVCQKYAHGCAFIRERLASLSPPAMLEAARLLADAEMHRRCAVRTESNEEVNDVAGLASDLQTRLKEARLPPSMTVAINTLLGCVIDPSRTVSEFSADAMKQVIYRVDVHHHLACGALDSEQWPQFKLIMKSCPLSPHHSPILVFHIVDFILRNPERRREVIEWYMDSLSEERLPLNQTQWSKYAMNVIRVCDSKADPVSVTKQGEIKTVAGKKLQLSIPPEEPITEEDFQSLKTSLNNLLSELSKRSGSVTKKEVAAARQSIRSWSRAGEKAVIIDSLNVFHGAVKGLGPLVKLTNRLVTEYENAIVITRPFLADKLKTVRWHGNVRIFSCTTLSEDDLLVLLAAMEWGRNAYVLSNDRFGLHVERIQDNGRLSLQDWMRRRMLRFNRLDWQYDCLPDYGEFVQRIGPTTYFVPVLEETPGIPERSSFVVTL